MNEKILASFKKAVQQSKDILIIQADNPDGDSLGSSAALEQILHKMDKNPVMYCKVNIPRHLRYIQGWDRVVDMVTDDFDMAIAVDCSSEILLSGAIDAIGRRKFTSRPLYAIDHHTSSSTLTIGDVMTDEHAVATCEQIYDIAQELDWPLDETSGYAMLAGIMSDSLGLTTEKTTAKSVRTVAGIIDLGVKTSILEDKRRQLMRRSREITALKGRLISEIEYSLDARLASIDIDWDTIHNYSNQYNPSILVLDEMRLTMPVEIAIAYKSYPDGRITGKLRSNLEAPHCHTIAQHFDGGGHPHSAGFRITDGRSLEQIKSEVIRITGQVLDQEDRDE